MTIFQILKADHKKVAGLMSKIEKMEGKSAQRMRLFTQFTKEIMLHAKVEQLVVYKRLVEKAPAKDLTLEAYEEHGLVDHLIGQLVALAPTDEKWDAKFSVLKEIIEHHVEEEEGEMFKKMRRAFTTQELNEMGKEMLQGKKNPTLFALKRVADAVQEKVESVLRPEKAVKREKRSLKSEKSEPKQEEAQSEEKVA